MSESKKSSQYPNSSLSDPWDMVCINVSNGTYQNIRFMPTGKAGLDHKNPGDWRDYKDLEKESMERLEMYMTPKTYMSMFYNEKLFAWFLHDGLHLSWEKFKYFQLDAIDNSFQEICLKRDSLTCKILHMAVQPCIRTYLTQISLNILNGDYPRINNIRGPRFMLQSKKVEQIEHIHGFMPYFHDRIENDKTGVVSSIYMIYNAQTGLELIRCSAKQHAHIMLYIGSVTPLKMLDSMCAFCGKARGDGRNSKLLKCSCKSCRYCSKNCQLKHWPAHKPMCTMAVKSAAVPGIAAATMQRSEQMIDRSGQSSCDSSTCLLEEVHELAAASEALVREMQETVHSFEANIRPIGPGLDPD